jgi:hypothetical protein
MKWYLLAGALIVILIGVLLALFSAPSQPSTSAPAGGGFPIASSTGAPPSSAGSTGGGDSGGSAGTGANQSGPTADIATQHGTLVVNDFLHNGTTEPDAQNPGNYYLATTSSFAIGYDSGSQFFTIALTEEPIGSARLQAEQFLETALGISQPQMCSLRYYLGTDIYTNSFYGGENLGFSFCPGAVALPQ